MQSDPQQAGAPQQADQQTQQHYGIDTQRETLKGAMYELADVTNKLLTDSCSGNTCSCFCKVPKLTWHLQQSACAIADFSCTHDLWQQTQQVLAKLASVLFKQRHETRALRATAEVYSV